MGVSLDYLSVYLKKPNTQKIPRIFFRVFCEMNFELYTDKSIQIVTTPHHLAVVTQSFVS